MKHYPFIALLAIATCCLESGCGGAKNPNAPPSEKPAAAGEKTEPTIELSDTQLKAIKMEPVGVYTFVEEKTGIANITFDNNLYADPSLSIQVFPPVSGKIIKAFVELGDLVQKDQPLYSLEGADPKDSNVVVRSPLAGLVTSVSALPDLPVQPGVAPAPCAVADVSTKWIVANIPEAESPSYHEGQPVEVRVMAQPDHVYSGKLSKVYPTVDPNNHRVTIRCKIADPENELRSGMLANFRVRVQEPVESVAIPTPGVFRNGDGTMAAWITVDKKHFTQRIIKIGLQRDGKDQVLEGLRKGELAVSEGAIFLSSMLNPAEGED